MRLRAVFAAVLLALLAFWTSAARAEAADVQHGIGFTKGCTSPTKVGDPYSCTWTIRNTLDEAQDTLTIDQIVDTVHAAAPFGNQVSSTVLFNAPVVVNNPALVTCAAASGNGSFATPYLGVTSCTIKFGGRVDVGPFSFYTVHPTDFAGANPLTDEASLTWHDLCDDPAHTGNTNCNPSPPAVGSASLSTISRRGAQTATTIHNAAHAPVTVVESGAFVHDFVSVTTNDPSPLNPTPSGTVTTHFVLNNQCFGSPDATSAPTPLLANGTVDVTGLVQGPLGPGFYGFRADYAGDNTYNGSDGACESLRVVDANIQLAPATATNPVGTNHTVVCHIDVNDGTGSVSAPDGTICTVSIISGPGSPTSQNCTIGTPTPGTGSCAAVITSGTAGTSVIRASTNVTVAGLVLHRETGDAHVGDGPDAQKVWGADANIQIAPATAANAVGANHVLTITVNAIGGTIDAGPHTASASIVSGQGSFVGPSSCTYSGGGASASCTVTITSGDVGVTVIRATSDIPVDGASITRTTGTDPGPGGSGDASKNWVDANVQIGPATATNEVGTNHVLTITVNAVGGLLNAGPHTASASIISGPGSFVGSPTCTYTGGAATASCTVTITSAVAGTTMIQATANIPVEGVSIARTTGTAANSAAGGSGNAAKEWMPRAPRDLKAALLAEVVARRDATPPTQWDYPKLRDAANELNQSLGPQYWLDGDHLDPRGGEHVFDDEKAAVGKLRQILRDNRSAAMAGYRDLLQGWIDDLVGIDRTLAETAIADATAAGGKADRLTKANGELAKGDQSAARGDPQGAIDHYKKAWQQARDSLN